MFCNTYQPRPRPSLSEIQSTLDPSTTYDVNSAVPIPSSNNGTLETPHSKVALVPFIPAIHARPFMDLYSASRPEIERYLPWIWATLDDFLMFLEEHVRRDEAWMLFAVVDKTTVTESSPRPIVSESSSSTTAVHLDLDANVGSAAPGQGSLAGVIGWTHASLASRSLEMGPVIIFPEFRGTHVAKQAIALLLSYILDSQSEGGLGFRRVVWGADPRNGASLGVAKRMGFKEEGTARWLSVMPEGTEGRSLGNKERERGLGDGMDNVILSVCWDDWVNGGVKDLAAGIVGS